MYYFFTLYKIGCLWRPSILVVSNEQENIIKLPIAHIENKEATLIQVLRQHSDFNVGKVATCTVYGLNYAWANQNGQ